MIALALALILTAQGINLSVKADSHKMITALTPNMVVIQKLDVKGVKLVGDEQVPTYFESGETCQALLNVGVSNVAADEKFVDLTFRVYIPEGIIPTGISMDGVSFSFDEQTRIYSITIHEITQEDLMSGGTEFGGQLGLSFLLMAPNGTTENGFERQLKAWTFYNGVEYGDTSLPKLPDDSDTAKAFFGATAKLEWNSHIDKTSSGVINHLFTDTTGKVCFTYHAVNNRINPPIKTGTEFASEIRMAAELRVPKEFGTYGTDWTLSGLSEGELAKVIISGNASEGYILIYEYIRTSSDTSAELPQYTEEFRLEINYNPLVLAPNSEQHISTRLVTGEAGSEFSYVGSSLSAIDGQLRAMLEGQNEFIIKRATDGPAEETVLNGSSHIKKVNMDRSWVTNMYPDSLIDQTSKYGVNYRTAVFAVAEFKYNQDNAADKFSVTDYGWNNSEMHPTLLYLPVFSAFTTEKYNVNINMGGVRVVIEVPFNPYNGLVNPSAEEKAAKKLVDLSQIAGVDITKITSIDFVFCDKANDIGVKVTKGFTHDDGEFIYLVFETNPAFTCPPGTNEKSFDNYAGVSYEYKYSKDGQELTHEEIYSDLGNFAYAGVAFHEFRYPQVSNGKVAINKTLKDKGVSDATAKTVFFNGDIVEYTQIIKVDEPANSTPMSLNNPIIVDKYDKAHLKLINPGAPEVTIKYKVKGSSSFVTLPSADYIATDDPSTGTLRIVIGITNTVSFAPGTEINVLYRGAIYNAPAGGITIKNTFIVYDRTGYGPGPGGGGGGTGENPTTGAEGSCEITVVPLLPIIQITKTTQYVNPADDAIKKVNYEDKTPESDPNLNRVNFTLKLTNNNQTGITPAEDAKIAGFGDDFPVGVKLIGFKVIHCDENQNQVADLTSRFELNGGVPFTTAGDNRLFTPSARAYRWAFDGNPNDNATNDKRYSLPMGHSIIVTLECEIQPDFFTGSSTDESKTNTSHAFYQKGQAVGVGGTDVSSSMNGYYYFSSSSTVAARKSSILAGIVKNNNGISIKLPSSSYNINYLTEDNKKGITDIQLTRWTEEPANSTSYYRAYSVIVTNYDKNKVLPITKIVDKLPVYETVDLSREVFVTFANVPGNQNYILESSRVTVAGGYATFEFENAINLPSTATASVTLTYYTKLTDVTAARNHLHEEGGTFSDINSAAFYTKDNAAVTLRSGEGMAMFDSEDGNNWDNDASSAVRYQADFDVKYHDIYIQPGIFKEAKFIPSGKESMPEAWETTEHKILTSNVNLGWIVTVGNANDALKDIEGGKVYDYLPAGFKFKENIGVISLETGIDIVPGSVKMTMVEGRQLVSWELTRSSIIRRGVKVSFAFVSTTPQALAEYDNDVYFVPVNDMKYFFSGKIDTNYATDYIAADGEDNVTEQNCVHNVATVAVLGQFMAKSLKTVYDEADPANKATPTEHGGYITVKAENFYGPGESPAQAGTGKYYYTLYVQNKSDYIFSNLVIIDKLPFVGDTSTVDHQNLRLSRFNAELLGVDMTYGNADKISKVEFAKVTVGSQEFSSLDWKGTTGAGTQAWHEGMQPGDNAVRLILQPDFKVDKGESIEFKINAKVPESASDGSIAWNTFGYAGSAKSRTTGTTDELKPVGPAKVGVRAVNFVGDIQLIKYDSRLYSETGDNTGAIIAGAKFKIFREEEGQYVPFNIEAPVQVTGADCVGNELTLTTGKLTLSNLPPGKYKLVETQAPEGYILPADESKRTYEFEAGGTKAVVLTALNAPSQVEIEKKDSVTGAELIGAEFELYDSNNQKVTMKYTDKEGNDVSSETLVFDRGKMTVYNLKDGVYKLVETKAPAGYVLENKTVSFKMDNGVVTFMTGEGEEGDTVTVITVTNKASEFELYKIDVDSKALLDGAIFRVWKKVNGQFVQAQIDNIKVVGGKVTVTGFGDGEYGLQEIAAPDGYILPVNEDENGKPLFAVTFTLVNGEIKTINGEAYVKPEGEKQSITVTNKVGQVTLKKVETGTDKTLEGAKFKLYKIVGGVPTQMTNIKVNGVVVPDGIIVTPEGGAVTITGLANGSYYFEEFEAPGDYVIKIERYNFTIDGKATDPIVIKAENDALLREIHINKKDKVTSVLLKGAVFEIRRDSDNFLMDTITTDANGYAFSRKAYLLGVKYKIVEIVAPLGYIRLSSPIYFTFVLPMESAYKYTYTIDNEPEIIITEPPTTEEPGTEEPTTPPTTTSAPTTEPTTPTTPDIPEEFEPTDDGEYTYIDDEGEPQGNVVIVPNPDGSVDIVLVPEDVPSGKPNPRTADISPSFYLTGAAVSMLFVLTLSYLDAKKRVKTEKK